MEEHIEMDNPFEEHIEIEHPTPSIIDSLTQVLEPHDITQADSPEVIPAKSQRSKHSGRSLKLPATLVKKIPNIHFEDEGPNECEQSSESYYSDDEVFDERGENENQNSKSPLINNISVNKQKSSRVSGSQSQKSA